MAESSLSYGMIVSIMSKGKANQQKVTPPVARLQPFVTYLPPAVLPTITDTWAWVLIATSATLCPHSNREINMNYQNGQLRNDPEATLRLRLHKQKHNCSFGEYFPLVVLATFLMSLLITGLMK